MAAELDRREFLEVAGAGLLITTAGCEASGQTQALNHRLHVGVDGIVTVLTGKVELGQGAQTQLTMAAAEELRLPPEKVRMVMADTDRTPDDGGTSGSRTTPGTVPRVRNAAAATREILIEAASKRWGIESAGLEVNAGAVAEPGGGRSFSYADLARLDKSAFAGAIPSNVELTPVSEWKVMGTTLAKLGAEEIVTGRRRYPSDISRPGMLYGKVLRPPSYGATLEDVKPAEMAGVTLVHDGDFIGCAASTSWKAQQGVDAIAKTAQWKSPEQPSSKGLAAHLKAQAVREGSGRGGPRIREEGSVEDGLTTAKHRLRASYEVPYVQHAPMEPRAAVAEWTGGKLTVWTGTQQPLRVRQQLAGAFGLEESQVRVIEPGSGGGFGGKHSGETAIEAARLAKAAGRPVSVRWTREEEFTWAYFRPAGLFEIEAGLDEADKIVAWDFTTYNAGSSAIAAPYTIPHRRESFYPANSPLREGSYRALSATTNNFAREAFLDELAAAAGVDPLEFRLANTDMDRLRDVLNAAAERFGWKRSREKGVGVGIACGTEKGSYVAACAEVVADKDRGTLEVRRICQAFECGAVINPGNLKAQVEGCIIMGLGAAMTEGMRFDNGRILNARFSGYRVPRLKDVPVLETVQLNRKDLPSVGGSETPIIAVAPAIANAVFNAIGVRVRSLPIPNSLASTSGGGSGA